MEQLLAFLHVCLPLTMHLTIAVICNKEINKEIHERTQEYRKKHRIVEKIDVKKIGSSYILFFGT